MKPILTVEEMRAWEQATWDAGITEEVVIETVGQKLARIINKITRSRDRILLVAGKGNNGEDVRKTLPNLDRRKVQLLSISDAPLALGELKTALETRPDWVVDGLFGIGLDRPLEGAWREMVEAINASPCRVISVDTPSGLSGSDGRALGVTIQSDITVTLGAVKAGLISGPDIDAVGQLLCESDIGLVPCPTKETPLQWVDASAFESYPPRRRPSSHKGTYGHVVILGGSLGFHGAAVLAAKAATKARPGLVSVSTSPQVWMPIATQLSTQMVRLWEHPTPEKTSCIVAGPGMAGAEVDSSVKNGICGFWQKSQIAMVADASALDWLPPHEECPGIRVVTPHPGEAARMLGISTAAVEANRVDAVRRISRKLGNCIVVLKGRFTLVGTSEGPVTVNGSGNPSLAQGGSGDLLAGFLGGLLAQKELAKDPLKTVRYGVWRHGHVADRLEARNSHWTLDNEFLSRL